MENKTTYEVILNPSLFFPEAKLPANNFYISQAIQNINVNFNYLLQNNIQDNISYSYNITATLKSFADNGTKLIWSKSYNLENKQNLINKTIIIKQNFTFDYNYYVNYIKELENQYKLKTESYLVIKLSLNIENNSDSYVELLIPLNKDIIEITMHENKPEQSNKEKFNIDQIGLELCLIALIILFILRKNLNKSNPKNLLKKYQHLIITIQNKPDLNSLNLLYINKFSDFLNIAEDYNTNIFNYQNNYYIIVNDVCYIYIHN